MDIKLLYKSDNRHYSLEKKCCAKEQKFLTFQGEWSADDDARQPSADFYITKRLGFLLSAPQQNKKNPG